MDDVLRTRELAVDDWPEAMRLGKEGFGYAPGSPVTQPPDAWPPEGQSGWGTFVGDRMVARVAGRNYHSWFGGVEVPTLGVAGVTVEAEHRGHGLLRDLFAKLVEQAAENGQVISTLYPTAPGIYRRFGYELVGTYRRIELPTAQLQGIPRPNGVRTRRAGPADVAEIERVYAAWASAQNGPLTRTGPLFDPAGMLTAVTGATVAVDDAGTVVGYALWWRGEGYDDSATLLLEDLVGLTPDATRALWRVAASFASVTGHVRVDTSGDDVTRLVLPGLAWREVRTNPYMLRVLDVPGALSLLRTAPGILAEVDFSVRGDGLADTDGDYRLSVDGGRLTCVRGGEGGRTFTPQGLALAFAGVQSSANLRMAGHLTGDDADDTTWDAVLGGRPFHVRDYF